MGALGQLGGAIGGYSGASKAEDVASLMRDAQMRAIRKMRKMQRLGMLESEEFFDLALGELDKVGPQMRQELLAQGEQGLAATEASAIGTGLSGTTAMAGQKRGMRMDIGRTLASLEESLAGSRAGMLERRGTERYQQRLDRANIMQRTQWDTMGPQYLQSVAGKYADLGAGLGAFGDDMVGAFMPGGGGMAGMFT